MPATTPLKRRRLLATAGEGGAWVVDDGWWLVDDDPSPFVIGPKRKEFRAQTGRAPIVKMSRMIPPTPVAAPWNGSTALGWLCDSILNAIAHPSPMSITPAFSSPAPTRIFFDLVGNVLSS